MSATLFDRVLVANRGEIAVRVMRTLRRLGIESVAVYTDADRLAPHVTMADVAVPLGAATAYLDAGRLVEAALSSGAQAVHPGYGFLSENPAFARACHAAGLTWIGPPAEAIETMGDKINAKRTVAASGVPVVPGRDEAGLDDAQLVEAALAVGLPVLLKPSAGGGGKGMRLVTDAAELPGAIAAARREAVGAFGDGTLLVERFVSRPRHIEMQVFADRHGHVVALGERECSLQRRHQKIVEEAPSPLLDDDARSRMAASAVAAARACGYVGAGTVEFIVSADRPGDYFFMEMNTRLQVEHPVTEMVLGVDLVEQQIRVAAGEPLPWAEGAVPAPTGHAVEARIYAEDPARGFLPSSGPVLAAEWPEHLEAVRVDAGVVTDSEVGTTYDPMLAKVVAWGPDRPAALRRLQQALASTVVLGPATNIGFLGRLLADPDVQAGALDTGLVERRLDAASAGPPPDEVFVAAALLDSLQRRPPGVGQRGAWPWELSDGWRAGAPAIERSRWSGGGRDVEVALIGGVAHVDGTDLGPAQGRMRPDGRVEVVLGGALVAYTFARSGAGEELWLARGGETWPVRRLVTGLVHSGPARAAGGEVCSPMPGTVVSVAVSTGQPVEAGQPLVTVEAMKMEHVVTAASDGEVAEVLVRAGDPVRLDQPLIRLTVAG